MFTGQDEVLPTVASTCHSHWAPHWDPSLGAFSIRWDGLRSYWPALACRQPPLQGLPSSLMVTSPQSAWIAGEALLFPSQRPDRTCPTRNWRLRNETMRLLGSLCDELSQARENGQSSSYGNFRFTCSVPGLEGGLTPSASGLLAGGFDCSDGLASGGAGLAWPSPTTVRGAGGLLVGWGEGCAPGGIGRGGAWATGTLSKGLGIVDGEKPGPMITPGWGEEGTGTGI